MKWLLGALMLANLGLFAWAQGWLGLPAPDQAQREPWRLQRQVQPEAITVLGAAPPGAASLAPAAAPENEPATQAAKAGLAGAASAVLGASAPPAASAPAPQSPGGGGQSR